MRRELSMKFPSSSMMFPYQNPGAGLEPAIVDQAFFQSAGPEQSGVPGDSLYEN